MMPKLGIFWVFKGKVMGRAVSLEEAEEGVPGLLDSKDNHTELWDTGIQAAHLELRGKEYFEIPRGRVLWDKVNHRAIVYLDSRLLTRETKAKIASFFHLQDNAVVWRTDLHYSTDPEKLEKIFID